MYVGSLIPYSTLQRYLDTTVQGDVRWQVGEGDDGVWREGNWKRTPGLGGMYLKGGKYNSKAIGRVGKVGRDAYRVGRVEQSRRSEKQPAVWGVRIQVDK